MKRISFLAIWKMLLIFQVYQIADAATPEIILYVMGDDIGPGDLGFNLNTPSPSTLKIRTPNLDQLRSESALYPNVIGATVCGPSRASFLTGRSQTYLYWRGNPELTKNYPVSYSLPQAFVESGWTTILSGKFGFGDCFTSQSVEKFYFNHSLYHATHIDAHYPFPNSLYQGCKKILYPNNLITNQKKCLSSKCTSANDLFLSFTLKQIETCITERQRCAIFYMPTYTHVGKYSYSKKSYYPVNSYEGYPAAWRADLRGYAAMLTKFDKQLGSIMQILDSFGKRNSTLTFIFSDNGAECMYVNTVAKCNYNPFASNGGRKGRKRSMYQGGILTPVIANWPGTISGKQSSNFPWALHDLALTSLDIIGAPQAIKNKFAAPSEITEGTPISVAKMLLEGDQHAPSRNLLFSENCEHGEASCTYAVFNTSDWRNSLPKLVCNKPRCAPEFYELRNDPAENTNLGNLPANQVRITQLNALRRQNRKSLKL